MQDVAAFDAVLKDNYAGPIRNQLNEKTRLLDFFTKGDIKQYPFEGRQVIIPLRKSRNTGVKATAESGLLPTAGKQGYSIMKVPIKHLHGRIELTIQVMKQARSDKGSFARAMESEQSGLIEDLSRQRNRILAGFGKGTVGVVSSVAGAVLTIKNPGGIAGTTNVLRFLAGQVGGYVAVHSGDSSTVRGVEAISSVDLTNGTITLANAVAGAAANDVITLGATDGSTDEGSYNAEPMGILGIVDSTTYVSSFHNIDRSDDANAFFRSTIFGSVGVISPDLMQRAIDNAEERSGEVFDGWVSHSSVRREYLKMTEADRRYSGNAPANLDAGTQAGAHKADAVFATLPIRIDKDFAYGTLVGVNKQYLLWLPETEGEWADEDGSVLGRTKDKDTYEARYRVFENFTTVKGNAHVRLDAITANVTANVFAD